MKSLHYELELEEDVVLPRGEGRIPGAVLLGAAAMHYAKAAPTLAWDLFHSGRVRFGDAGLRGADDSVSALPVPLCMYAPKGYEPELGWTDDWKNYLGISESDRVKGRLRACEGFVHTDGREARAHMHYALRTAVDFSHQRARDAQLFGQWGLPAGTCLRGRVDVDDAVVEEAEAFLKSHLQGAVFLGRRIRASNGRAKLTWIPKPSVLWQVSSTPSTHGTDGADRVHVWFTSPVCLLDADTGMPTSEIRPSHFGLDPAKHEVVARDSFLRTVRWSPFNGHRRRPDVERVAVAAGSVVTLSGFAESQDIRDLAARLEAGLGLHRNEGLGQVLVQPSVLLDGVAALEDRPGEAPSASVGVPPAITGDSREARWLRGRAQWVGVRQDARKAADKAFEDTFRRFARAKKSLPGPTQWTAVAGCARRYAALPGGATLVEETLFADAPRRMEGGEEVVDRHRAGLLRRGAAAKRWFGRDDGPGPALQSWLESLESVGDEREMLVPLALGLLSERMAKAIQHQGRAE